MASAADSVEFTTQVKVDSVNKCSATTTAGDTGSAWNITWKLDNAGQTNGSGTLDFGTAEKEPLEVKAHIDAGPSACQLGKMSIAVDMGSAESAGVTSAAYRSATMDGYWRYMPVVANVKLYTDTAYATATANAVTVKGADAADYVVGSTAVHNAQMEIAPNANLNWGSIKAYVLSNGYMGASGYAPLTFEAKSPAVTWTQGGTPDKIKSVIVGVSSIIAANPEKQDGSVYLDAVNDTEVVNMPFTVNVTYF